MKKKLTVGAIIGVVATGVIGLLISSKNSGRTSRDIHSAARRIKSAKKSPARSKSTTKKKPAKKVKK